MPADYVDELQAEAEAAIERMREAAREARRLHARAELLRHMRTTAEKMKDGPREAAVAQVVREWMDAWGLSGGELAGCEPQMRAFTAAVCAAADAPGGGADAAVREATAALERALAARGGSLADQMAWRSECAHGWWELVAPTPPEFARPDRRLPQPAPGEPFWAAGCAPHCGPAGPPAPVAPDA